MCCVVSGKLALSKRASITASLLYNLPKPQATIGVCRGSCVILQCFQRNDNSESLSFCKYETNIWNEHLPIQPNRNVNVLQKFNQYLYKHNQILFIIWNNMFPPISRHPQVTAIYLCLNRYLIFVVNGTTGWYSLTIKVLNDIHLLVPVSFFSSPVRHV
jgi:hypothetical protein